MNAFKFVGNAIEFFNKAKNDVLLIDFFYIALVDGDKTGAIVVADSNLGEENRSIGFVSMDWKKKNFMIPITFNAAIKIVEHKTDLCLQVDINRAYRHKVSTSNIIREVSSSDASMHLRKYNDIFGKHDAVLGEYRPIVNVAREFGFHQEDVSIMPMPGVVDDVDTTVSDSEYALQIVSSFVSDALRSSLASSFIDHVESPIKAAMTLVACTYLGLDHYEIVQGVINDFIAEPKIDCVPDEHSIVDMVSVLYGYGIKDALHLIASSAIYASVDEVMERLCEKLPDVGIEDSMTIYCGLEQLLASRKKELEKLLMDDDKMSGEIISVPVESIQSFRPSQKELTKIGPFSAN